MEVRLHRKFLKMFDRLPQDIRRKFVERKNVLLDNSFDPILNNHALHGEYAGHRSINVTGSYRAVFVQENEVATFIAIGTHADLYE